MKHERWLLESEREEIERRERRHVQLALFLLGVLIGMVIEFFYRG